MTFLDKNPQYEGIVYGGQMKRVLLFFGINILVMISINIIYSALAAAGYVPSGYYGNIAVFSLLIGMGGSFFSLLISKWVAKSMMGVEIVERGHIVQMVHTAARKAGLEKMPEVGVYHSPEVNAFATGPSRSNSLVAVSSGLLDSMNQDEVEGVIAHEVAHIANGDMVTMTLVQGIVNAFAYFVSIIVSNIIQNALRGDREGGRGLGDFFIRQLIFSAVYGAVSFAAYPIIAWFSRWREYRADLGGAKIAGKHKMIAALERLQNNVDRIEKSEQSFQAMKISNRSGIMALMSTHPPLDQRIAALQKASLV